MCNILAITRVGAVHLGTYARTAELGGIGKVAGIVTANESKIRAMWGILQQDIPGIKLFSSFPENAMVYPSTYDICLPVVCEFLFLNVPGIVAVPCAAHLLKLLLKLVKLLLVLELLILMSIANTFSSSTTTTTTACSSTTNSSSTTTITTTLHVNHMIERQPSLLFEPRLAFRQCFLELEPADDWEWKPIGRCCVYGRRVECGPSTLRA
jgi:hypothetical protein